MAKKYLVIGQSNADRLFTIGTVAAVGDVTISTNGTTWTTPTSAGITTMLNALYAATTVAKVRYLYGGAPAVTGYVYDDTALALPLEHYAEPETFRATADTDHIDLSWPATTGPYIIERRVV